MYSLSVVLGIVHLNAVFRDGLTYDVPKPVLSLKPPHEVFLNGENLTMTCYCQCPLKLNQYYRGQDPFVRVPAPEGQCETKFEFKDVEGYEDNYTCECAHLENGQWRDSERSDPVQIIVRDELSEPNIYRGPDSGAVSNGDDVTISCKGDIRSRGGTFQLYKDRKGNPVQTRTVRGYVPVVTFTINTRSEGSEGNYSCRYQTEVAGKWRQSPFSKDVPITEIDAENSSLLNIGLGCIAGIIVLLVVVLTWFFIAKRRQVRRQNIARSADSAGGASNHEDADNTYDTANHPSLPDQNGVYAQVSESNHQELTYATLNMEALNQKEAASVTAVDSVLYAEVKRK